MTERADPPPAIALLAEASQNVGTGHLMEMFTLAKLAQSLGYSIKLWVNQDAQKQLISQSPCPVEIIRDFSAGSLYSFSERVTKSESKAIVTNLRRIDISQVRCLRASGLPIVCIDEFGNRSLDCDAIINPSIVPSFHSYAGNNSGLKIYAGPSYILLSETYRRIGKLKRNFDNEIESILISMGGVDRSGATITLLAHLLEIGFKKRILVTAGAGFSHGKELEMLIQKDQDKVVTTLFDLISLDQVFSQADLGITAGGNTLYEMACAGLPSIVAYEDDHERMQGEAFENAGYGICIGQGCSVSKAELVAALNEAEDPSKRESWANKGRLIVDGRGAERILSIVSDLIRRT